MDYFLGNYWILMPSDDKPQLKDIIYLDFPELLLEKLAN